MTPLIDWNSLYYYTPQFKISLISNHLGFLWSHQVVVRVWCQIIRNTCAWFQNILFMCQWTHIPRGIFLYILIDETNLTKLCTTPHYITSRSRSIRLRSQKNRKPLQMQEMVHGFAAAWMVLRNWLKWSPWYSMNATSSLRFFCV